MLQNISIGASQFRKLVIMFSCGNSILLVPSLLAEEAAQDAWISSIIGVTVGLLLVWFYQKLACSFPKKAFPEYIPTIFGKWLGKIIVLLIFAFSFGLSVMLLRSIGDFITITTYPETPMAAIHIFCLSIVVIGFIYGLENIARTCEIFIPWLYIFGLFFFLLIISDIEIKSIQPIYEHGMVPILNGSFLLFSSSFLELVLLLFIYPHVRTDNNTKNHFLFGALMGGGILIVCSFVTISVLGAEETASEFYAPFILAQQIKVQDFLQRMGGFFSAIWIVTIYFKIIVCFYISVVSLAQTFGLNHYRFLSLPLAIILVILSINLFADINDFMEFFTKIWPYITLSFGLILPLFLLLALMIKRRF